MARRLPEMCFWPARTRKNLNFLRCLHVFDLVLKYCSEINEGNWLQLLFYFIVLMRIVASVIGMSFLSYIFPVLAWSFLALQCHGNVCNWNPKLIWPRLRFFWSFLLEYASFRRFHFCIDWNLHELLSGYFFWRDQSISIVSLRSILVCFLQMIVRF